MRYSDASHPSGIIAVVREIRALLDEVERQLVDVQGVYEASLRAKDVSPELKVRIKNILENQRSALEYLAAQITDRDGVKGSRTKYPLAPTAADFVASIDRSMPGVRAARPDVAAKIELVQPFQQSCGWLAALRDLTNENKHQRLSPQVRKQTWQRSFRGVTWTEGVKFGAGVLIGGVPVNPATQKPEGAEPVQETIYVDWQFEDLGVSAFGTLQEIQSNLRVVTEEIGSLAGI